MASLEYSLAGLGVSRVSWTVGCVRGTEKGQYGATHPHRRTTGPRISPAGKILRVEVEIPTAVLQVLGLGVIDLRLAAKRAREISGRSNLNRSGLFRGQSEILHGPMEMSANSWAGQA
jgi:hypothetical protein